MTNEMRNRRNFIRAFLVYIVFGMLTVGILAFLYDGFESTDGWIYTLGGILFLALYSLLGERQVLRFKPPNPSVANRLYYALYALYPVLAFLMYDSLYPLTIDSKYYPGRTPILFLQFFGVTDILIFLLMGYTMFRWQQSLHEIARQRERP